MPRGLPRITQTAYYDGPPIPLTVEDIAHRKDAKLGSIILAGAIQDLLNRMDAGEVAEVLGKARPSTAAPYRTASAMRRLAA